MICGVVFLVLMALCYTTTTDAKHPVWSNHVESYTCAGTSVRDAMDIFDSNTIIVRVDTSECQFEGTPLYFTSLSGTCGNLAATGSSAIYNPTSNEFNVKMRLPGLTAQEILDTASQCNWILNWEGVLRE
ncbi:unnamed protein product [Rotaria socialis]|uniref:Uncharacterized protein n=1 Tax=Rotaria socialis TaxID=392032 RepID=A0A818TCG0_9BILA|nr:unnamed protein product [Rotaria socialis]CAF3685162.1 unnamed protein product [Rotaria socialis]CAF4590330.1 unnamed protein product [Rotaria socialis]CAF4850512.1 unnamed protein product [Rotaria socialis]